MLQYLFFYLNRVTMSYPYFLMIYFDILHTASTDQYSV
jgi:hypothetical protein